MYKLSNSNSVIRLTDGANIPFDNSNTDYQQFLKWVSEGNTPEPPDVIEQLNQEIVISPWQFRTVLNRLSLRDAVENMVKNSDNYRIKDGWEFATSWREKHPLVQQMGLMLDLSEEDIHNIFEMASEIDTL